VVGDLDGVAALALTAGYGAVAVGPAAGWTPYRLRQLARDLDGSRTRLLVDPALVDVGPGLHAVTLDGLPLLRLTRPVLGPAPRLVKGMVDRGVALALLLLLSPLLLSIATAVRRDGGRALCRETRVGRNGREFRLLRFRTACDDCGSPTPVGQALRRHSLEGLPQLLNVLAGSMALVGPRPPVPAEVRGGGHLPVKPGVTGLGGAGRQTWPETLRLSLRYAAEWSPVLDAHILARTMRAALSGELT
jgi:lipopolysaccharide/colanic/teichoic acid biosynthesis glycosyltransferase